MAGAERSFEELTTGAGAALDDLVDRASLLEMIESFAELFRVPVRVFAEGSGMVGQAGGDIEIYRYLRQFSGVRPRIDQTISQVAALQPRVGEELGYECITGAVYRVGPIVLDGRRIGKFVLGPFLPPSVKSVPKPLLSLDSGLDPDQVKRLLASLPRARVETVSQISQHLQKTLDLILYSGHKALLTSSMHLLSVRESYRELQEKNASLQQAYDSLKELDRLKNNFLATVSHELRTPLTSIIGYSEMLQAGIAGALNAEQLEFATTIFEKGTQLLELITGLLDLSKLESGTLTVQNTQVDIEVLVRDVLSTLAPLATKKGVKLRADLEPGLPKLRGDPTRLRQVVLNLTDNAVKFTDAGGSVSVSVEMDTMEPPESGDEGRVLMAVRQPAICLTVRDTGIGIADSEKTRVFDAFYQIDQGTTRQEGGTGLGLSIVKRLVEAHHGSISVTDNEPQGAAFVIHLPLAMLTLS